MNNKSSRKNGRKGVISCESVFPLLYHAEERHEEKHKKYKNLYNLSV